jgi:hypothetical protein
MNGDGIKTYFIQSSAGGPIKIGQAVNPKKRLSGLQTSHTVKLEILAVLNENRESELHGRFRALRVRGEWYRCERPLVDYLLENFKLSKAHQERLRQALVVPLNTVEPPKSEVVEGVFGCDLVVDRSTTDEGELSNNVYAMFDDSGPECDCGDSLDVPEPREQHFENACSWAIFQHVADLVAQSLPVIERLGIDSERRTLHLVTRYLNTVPRQTLFEDLGEIAFNLDYVYWKLSITAFGPEWDGPRVFDGYQLFLESIKRSRPCRPIFGDPECIRLRDWGMEK